MSNVCLACGHPREDPRDSFTCPACQGQMILPPDWEDVIYWMIFLRGDLVYLVKEFVRDPRGKLQLTHVQETDTLGAARALLPRNVKAVHRQSGPVWPDTLVEVWQPLIEPSDSGDGAGP